MMRINLILNDNETSWINDPSFNVGYFTKKKLIKTSTSHFEKGIDNKRGGSLHSSSISIEARIGRNSGRTL